MCNEQIKICSLKFDRSIRRSWTGELVRQEGALLELVGEFEFEVDHPNLGIIRPGTVSYEYYWLDRWYNVFRFHEPDGSVRNYYCNINMPPTLEKNVLEYVDLDIDLLVWKDWSQEILDLDEFEQNAVRFGYDDSLIKQVHCSLDELKSLIDNREFPFDHIFLETIGTKFTIDS